MPRVSKEQKALDKEISYLWARRASGVQVDIMAIPRIFAECREARARGVELEDAIDACIAKYRRN